MIPIDLVTGKTQKKERKIKMQLTNKEKNVLNLIATRSKMDCWFFLGEDKLGRIYFYDLEEGGRRRPLKDGISELAEGMTGYTDYSLTEEEIKTFEGLLKRAVSKEDFNNLVKYLRKEAA